MSESDGLVTEQIYILCAHRIIQKVALFENIVLQKALNPQSEWLIVENGIRERIS